jgi:hypothetical protein
MIFKMHDYNFDHGQPGKDFPRDKILELHEANKLLFMTQKPHVALANYFGTKQRKAVQDIAANQVVEAMSDISNHWKKAGTSKCLDILTQKDSDIVNELINTMDIYTKHSETLLPDEFLTLLSNIVGNVKSLMGESQLLLDKKLNGQVISVFGKEVDFLHVLNTHRFLDVLYDKLISFSHWYFIQQNGQCF